MAVSTDVKVYPKDILNLSLKDLLKSPDLEVRRKTIQFLGKMGFNNEEVIEELIKALFHESTAIREQAILALGRLKVEQAIPLLIDILSQPGESELKVAVTSALIKIGSDEIVEQLVPNLVSADPDIRWHSAYILGTIDSPNAQESLLEALKSSDPEIRANAVVGLGKIEKNNDNIINILLGIIENDEAETVRIKALASLGTINLFKNNINDLQNGAA